MTPSGPIIAKKVCDLCDTIVMLDVSMKVSPGFRCDECTKAEAMIKAVVERKIANNTPPFMLAISPLDDPRIPSC